VKKSLPFLALFFAGCVHFPSYRTLVEARPARRIVIEDVRVFPATGLGTLEHTDVVVDDGLVTEIAPTSSSHHVGGLVIPGQGRTLLPGLVDIHVHSTMSCGPPWYLVYPSAEHNLQAHLFAGVTTVLDMGGAISDLIEAREKIARGEWLGPRIFYAGPIITAPGGYPGSLIRKVYGALAASSTLGKLTRPVESPDEATLAVRENWAHGARIIKVVVADIPRGAPRLSEETLRAIVRQATQLGLPVAAHIDTVDDALLAARVGIRLFAHNVTTGALNEQQAKELAAAGIVLTPTLVNFERFDRLAEGKYEPTPVVRASEPPELLEEFGAEHVHPEDLSPDFLAFGREIQAHEADRGRNTKLLSDAGVPIVIGTDANGSVGSFPGGIHDELKLLVDAGVPPAEVLLGATSRAARFLESVPSFGTVEVGKSADLLLVEGNPLEDITATTRIVRVIVRGVPLVRTQQD
jgi:imidazolonepropionase-like amidohydrolase